MCHVTGDITNVTDNKLSEDAIMWRRYLLDDFVSSIVECHLSLAITSHTDLVELDSLAPCGDQGFVSLIDDTLRDHGRIEQLFEPYQLLLSHCLVGAGDSPYPQSMI
jgi:hypothetical protein